MITPDDALAHVSLLVHSLPPQPFVDGAFRATAHGETLDNVSPRDGTSINRIARCTTADVDLAVANAKATFDAGQWRHMAPRDRKRLLLHFADLIEAQAEDFALLECIDTGKPISATRSFDIPQAINTLRYYAEAIDKVYGEVGPSPASRLSYAVHEPLGVIGVIVPWNFPLHLAMWKIAPALATGNTLVMKPSELTSLTALKLARTAIEGGLPAGVLNVVTGLGHEAGDALARHMDVQLIAFTGSERTGRQLLRAAADSNLKRVSLELGGKSPHIVFADWQDLDMVATQAAWGIFYNQGQVCTAGSRLLVERAVMETLLDRVTRRSAGRSDEPWCAVEQGSSRSGLGTGRPCTGGRAEYPMWGAGRTHRYRRLLYAAHDHCRCAVRPPTGAGGDFRSTVVRHRIRH